MNIKKVIEEKKEWKSYQARIKSLPKQYQIVYQEVKKYLFKVSCTEGISCDSILLEILDLFEEGAVNGKNVLDITGIDVASFCDNLKGIAIYL